MTLVKKDTDITELDVNNLFREIDNNLGEIGNTSDNIKNSIENEFSGLKDRVNELKVDNGEKQRILNMILNKIREVNDSIILVSNKTNNLDWR